MATKDEIQAELDAANARIAELEATNAEQLPDTPRPPARPDFGLSAGEVDDLKNAGVTTSPFTGKSLNALDEGIEPANPEARRRAERDRAARKPTEVTPEHGAPIADPTL
jgi:hypothetical protein